MIKYLMDTNITSYLVESEKAKRLSRGKIVLNKIREAGYNNVFLNTVVVGEIYAGLYSKLTMKEERKKKIELEKSKY